MGRWRPPAAKSAPYITPEGYKILEDEMAGLWKKRNEVAKAVTVAAAEGDRSENAEYIYRKKQLREIDSRVGFLQRRMPKLTVVREIQDKQRIFFGAWVTVEDEEGNESRHRIVGADEFDRHKQFITVDSPLAKLLLGKTLDDEVILERKGTDQSLYITNIEYENTEN
ncbi:MAG TPA: transcription elongation factor GreB [Thiotrichaceae bacterium]|jgi:transcription elongation factor GreB|nr:transcription elongation factor GreB [Thiotrichaceae bacterium]HIM08755.1 transcription elongation factor GreB [Gammaproteobacteria bacterium]